MVESRSGCQIEQGRMNNVALEIVRVLRRQFQNGKTLTFPQVDTFQVPPAEPKSTYFSCLVRCSLPNVISPFSHRAARPAKSHLLGGVPAPRETCPVAHSSQPASSARIENRYDQPSFFSLKRTSRVSSDATDNGARKKMSRSSTPPSR